MQTPIVLDGQRLGPREVATIAAGAPVTLAPEARARMARSAEQLQARPVADVLASKWAWLSDHEAPSAPEDQVRAFLRGHCAGVGDPLEPSEVRALLACRINVLATGYSGVRPHIVDTLLAQLEGGLVPYVPRQGSVGAAGCPQLAHLMWVCCGFGGRAWRDGQLLDADRALQGLPVAHLNPKEALSLINGATLTTASAALTLALAERLLDTAEVAAAMSFEVVRADLGCLSEAALSARRHPGPVAVARRMRALLGGSSLCVSGRRPDPFSIRCTPAVLGAAREAMDHAWAVVCRELNGACDNPLVLPEEGLVEAGNFHGAPVALALDYLKVALTQVASISERRTFRMTYGQLSGLPSFLLRSTGINSGLMLAQYTAASLVSECKGLSHPASVDSLPTVQHREDHVSMGPIAADAAARVARCLADVLAIELLCAAQGLDFHLAGEAVDGAGEMIEVTPSIPGRGTLCAWRAVRERVSRWEDDRVLHPDLVALGEAVSAGVFAGRQAFSGAPRESGE
ncbi:MAG: histidine ammonia-lyase [Deltaproteobacteria bacterium]|nr:MAG: histidine ammonia-lyase [Deltaproteobacteria bacterium]